MTTDSSGQQIGSATVSEANEALENVQRFFLRSVAPALMESAGRHDGKYQSTTSLSTHTINATLLGLSVYVYDSVVRLDSTPDEEEARVLIASLALHDVNKLIGNETNRNTPSNTREILSQYFEEDPYEINAILPNAAEEYFEDLLYLIQRTEVGEDATETRGLTTEYRGLEVYCEIGDAVASAISADGLSASRSRLDRHYLGEDSSPVQIVDLTTTEQPLLHNLVLRTTKDVIRGEDTDAADAVGVILGSTPAQILYLGDPIDSTELQTRVADRVADRLISEYSGAFTCKAGWNSFDYGILAEVDVPFDTKRERIASEYIETVLKAGQGLDESFEAVPDGFEQVLPEVLKQVYVDGDAFEQEGLHALWETIRDDVGAQKAKVTFVATLAREYDQYATELQALCERLHEPLKTDLRPELSAITTIVERVFEGVSLSEGVSSADESCFLCGQPATTKYQKGAGALYGTNAFSKRVGVQQAYKRICPSCNLEYELFRHHADSREVSIRSDVLVVYFYFDEFIADVRLHADPVGGLIEDAIEFDAPDIALGLLGPQYHVQPITVSSRGSDKNRKLSIVRKVLQRVQEIGGKAMIGKPFIPFAPADDVFQDTEVLAEQEALHAAKVSTYAELQRPLELLNILAAIEAQTSRGFSGYLSLAEDSLVPLVNTVMQHIDGAERRTGIIDYIETYHTTEYMSMKQIAESGLELYGTQYGSKHAQTSVFRTTINAFLNGMNNELSNNSLIEFAAGQAFARANRQEYAGHVTVEQAETFARNTWTHLEDNNLTSIKRLSDWEDALVNTYHFAYVQVRDTDE